MNFRKILAVAALFCSLVHVAQAQINSGVITGIVKDSQTVEVAL